MILKKGIQVKIIAGKDKGKTGEIIEINRKSSSVKVKEINMVKKHIKPTKENKGECFKRKFYTSVKHKNLDVSKKKKGK